MVRRFRVYQNSGFIIGSHSPLPKESDVLRGLASHVMEISCSPKMDERKAAWKASNDGNSFRPVIMVETFAIKGFKDESMLVCEDPYLRDVEKSLREMIRHYKEIDDDYVIEPYYRLPWKVRGTGYGVDLGEKHAIDSKGGSTGYSYDYAIKTIEDLNKLEHNEFIVFREDTHVLNDKLFQAMGDVMPIKLGGIDAIFAEWEGIFNINDDAINKDGTRRYVGYTPFLGAYFVGVAMSLYKLLGNDHLVFWCFDHPETMHEIAKFIADDRIKYFDWLEKEDLLVQNTDNQIIGSGPFGYDSVLEKSLPKNGKCTLKNIWGWAEAQEAEIFSPDMFDEFILPYLAQVSNKFGKITYGCCERIDDRLERVLKKINNVSSVAVSPWNDDKIISEIVGKKFGYCRKIFPSYISGESMPAWDKMEQEIRSIFEATKNCNLQIVVRDVYDVNEDFNRLSKWAKMTRNILGI